MSVAFPDVSPTASTTSATTTCLTSLITIAFRHSAFFACSGRFGIASSALVSGVVFGLLLLVLRGCSVGTVCSSDLSILFLPVLSFFIVIFVFLDFISSLPFVSIFSIFCHIDVINMFLALLLLVVVGGTVFFINCLGTFTDFIAGQGFCIIQSPVWPGADCSLRSVATRSSSRRRDKDQGRNTPIDKRLFRISFFHWFQRKSKSPLLDRLGRCLTIGFQLGFMQIIQAFLSNYSTIHPNIHPFGLRS
mmetsp:Transcript_466/g.752  ORF Transcript_466/g.752 Transcript_466/m.752 type:complete len:248 (+) Transcript_466:299-1042(+)